jgi:eukaryotic-like serine/threonine-protein kinase
MIPQQVDILCDEFEAGLRRGGAPRIEELLGKMTQDHRAQLLYELLAVEIEFQLKRGQIVYLDELRLRFPDDAETLTLIFCSFLWQGAGFSTMTTGGDLMLRHFRLKALVGHGGFGTVWLADDTRLDREVAIKTPHAYGQQRSDGLRAALPEAAAATKLRHPHILPVYEVSEIDGRFFMVTDYASGGTLKQLLKSRAFTCTEVARLAAQLADALHHAHSHGVIHRDLKPSNVLINEAGSLLLADFGLAVNLGGAPVAEGLVCGTHAYMAPEQADGRFGGERADIYSLGVILEDMLEVASTSVSGEMPGRSGLGGSNRLVARALRKIGDKCCHLDPPQRYASAEALCTDLRRVSEGKPPRNVQSGLRERTSWFVRRHWKALSGTLAGALLVAAAALSATPPPHPDARLVQIATDPPGCELAVVPLDPMTGDPIPERLERLRTRSPAKHYLVPGDYLVVAVQDMATFHEVVRHVPPKSEMIPFVHPHQRWRLVDNVIQLPVIRVQSPKWPRR